MKTIAAILVILASEAHAQQGSAWVAYQRILAHEPNTKTIRMRPVTVAQKEIPIKGDVRVSFGTKPHSFSEREKQRILAGFKSAGLPVRVVTDGANVRCSKQVLANPAECEHVGGGVWAVYFDPTKPGTYYFKAAHELKHALEGD